MILDRLVYSDDRRYSLPLSVFAVFRIFSRKLEVTFWLAMALRKIDASSDADTLFQSDTAAASDALVEVAIESDADSLWTILKLSETDAEAERD